jgi:putative PIN family toxin of toxin-antitoxin system
MAAIVAVFDTNVLISVNLRAESAPPACLALIPELRVRSVTCRQLLDEFHDKLVSKFGRTVSDAAEIVSAFAAMSEIVGISGTIKASEDPDDDAELDCAVVGRATHIVTGDKKHLLSISVFEGIQLVSPSDFLQIVRETNANDAR